MYKDKKVIAGVIAGILVVGGISFYAGTKSVSAKGGFGQNAGATGMNRQGGMGQFGTSGRMGGRGMAGGFTAGQIIAKDDTSITVKLPDGGSKIVFITGSTSINKAVAGTSADLAVNTNVVINGTPNSDGSINAASVQIGNDIGRVTR